jgi:hypothetical protein
MTEKGGLQADLLMQVNQLESRIEHEADNRDRDVLKAMCGRARKQVSQLELDAAKAEITNISKRLESLRKLRLLEQLEDGDHPDIQQLQQNIRRAIELLRVEQDRAAEKQITLIEQGLRTAHTNMMMGPAADQVDAEELVQAQENAVAAGQAAAQIVQVPPVVGFNRPRKFLAWLSGVSREAMAEATLWLARPLLYFVLIFTLIFVGLEQLYIKNPAFGANPFVDYAGLAFWAISSDVASRTLSSAKGSK